MICYIKYVDSYKRMFFKANDNRLLNKYAKIWERVSSLMNIKFHIERVYGDNDKYIKRKIKPYRDKVNTNQKKVHHTKMFVTDNIRFRY